MLVFRKILPIRIEIAVGHWTLSDKKCYMSATHVSKQDILSLQSISLSCRVSYMWKILQTSAIIYFYFKLWRYLIILFVQGLFKEY